MLLSRLFPQCKKWYLIDPAPGGFDPRLTKDDTGRFEIVESLFTHDMCEAYAKRLKGKHVLFLSDIRLEASNEGVERDNDLQADWVRILRPSFAQLKFRLPFSRKTYTYLDGALYLQMFAPQASTECRLVVKASGTAPLATRSYDVAVTKEPCTTSIAALDARTTRPWGRP